MIISIDFDDVIVYDNYPQIGKLLPNAKTTINYLYERGHEIIINTCRINVQEVKNFLKGENIKYDWINKNSPRQIKKYGTDTKKISCDVNIDDKNLFIQQDMYSQGKEVVQKDLWANINLIMYNIEKPLIICIVGESGSGKTLAGHYLVQQYDINFVQSYTDRPQRYKDESGHIFISKDDMDIIFNDKNVIAKTNFGEYRYCSLEANIFDYNVYIVDEVGLKMLQHDYDVYSIKIYRPLEHRIKSVGERRVIRDKNQFTLPDSYYDYVIDNHNEKQFLYNEIEKFIEQFRLKKRFTPYKL
jgi:guanylate kinase